MEINTATPDELRDAMIADGEYLTGCLDLPDGETCPGWIHRSRARPDFPCADLDQMRRYLIEKQPD